MSHYAGDGFPGSAKLGRHLQSLMNGAGRETLPAGAVVRTEEAAVVVGAGAAVPAMRVKVEKVKAPSQPVRKVFATTISNKR